MGVNGERAPLFDARVGCVEGPGRIAHNIRNAVIGHAPSGHADSNISDGVESSSSVNNGDAVIKTRVRSHSGGDSSLSDDHALVYPITGSLPFATVDTAVIGG